MIPDPGWLRPLLAVGLAVIGVALRFILPSRIGGFGVRLARAQPDEDLNVIIRHRVGEMLLVWAVWLLVQIAVGMRESWMACLWAPLVIVVGVALTLGVQLYAGRYLSDQGGPTVVRRSAWPTVLFREALPLGVILISILLVKAKLETLPEKIPVGWDFGQRAYTLMGSEAAIDMLRHRTMGAYLFLFGLEAAYLVFQWARHNNRDLAGLMITPRHQAYFAFKLGWVMLFAGLNVGFVYHAIDGRSPVLFALPGLFVLSAVALGSAWRGRLGGDRTSPPRNRA